MDTRLRLEGERIYLRPMTMEDSPLIVKWRNLERVRRNYIYREDFTLESQKAYYHNRIETGKTVQFMVCEKDTDEPVGCMVLNDIDAETKTCEIGLFLGEERAVGQGYSAEMVPLTVQYGFRELGMKRIIARAFTDNSASVKGLQKGGLRITGILKDVQCSDGTVKDMYAMEVVNDER